MQIFELWNRLIEQLTVEGLLFAVIPAAIIAVLKFIGIKIVTNLRRAFRALRDIIFSVPNYLQLLSFVQSAEKPIWEYRRFGSVDLHHLPPIITVMNFKGGVGKTTISANLAASFSIQHQKKVLLIDLDYQGSLSSELIPLGTDFIRYSNTTGKWLESTAPPKSASSDFLTPTGLPKVRLLTSDYELSDIEDNQMQRWLLKAHTNGDIRSRLARHLRAIRDHDDCDFDLIIMDAPPRLSLAAANAVRSSTMILIPTRLQYLGVQPIQKMLSRLSKFKDKSGGAFKIGGVICNFTANKDSPTGKEREHLDTIVEALDGHPDSPVVFSALIPNSPDIGASDARPCYLSKKSGPNAPGPIFDALSDEVLRRLAALKSQK